MQRDQNHILEDILETITASENPEQSLDRIVRMIAERFNIDACSVYVYNPYGDNMIIFTGHGTSGYNKRIHGGDLSLKSWLGFRKNIAVNCTGLVTEGVYPGEF